MDRLSSLASFGVLALIAALTAWTTSGTELGLRIGALLAVAAIVATARAPASAPAVVRSPPSIPPRAADDAGAGKRHRETYIAAVSHELRTPLNAILGFTQVLLSDIDGPLTDSQREDVTAIHDAGLHLRALVEEVIGESAGTLTARDIGPVDLEPIVRELGRGLDAQLRARPVTLRLVIEPNLPSPVGDARRLRQILWNLGTNAVRYTERGEITIRVAREGELLRLSVKDTGRGIAKEDLPRIFAIGERVETASDRPVRARSNEGWGLGLAIAREMAEFHGGHLEVESELGRGSTFHLVLPAKGRA